MAYSAFHHGFISCTLVLSAIKWLRTGITLVTSLHSTGYQRLRQTSMSDMIFLSDAVTYNAPLCCLEHVAGGESVHLTPNERKLLELILAQRGQKETIIEEIWGCHGVIVTSSSYHQLIKMLRSKFQRVGLSPEMLQTIPRYGVVLRTGLALDESDIDVDSSKPTRSVYQDQIISSFSCSVDTLNYNEHKSLSRGTLRSLYPYFLILILTGVLLLQLLGLMKNTDLFKHYQYHENVKYYATSSMLFNQNVMSRVMSKKTKNDSNVYITENGPKILVSYCNGDIGKDSTICRNDSFSSY